MEIDKTEYEQLKRGALRYRWVRARESDWSAMFATRIDDATVGLESGIYGHDLDAAIDAAMREGKVKA